MNKHSYIWHVTLGIGRGKQETRDHLTNEDLARFRAHIDRALVDPGGNAIPDQPGYAMVARKIVDGLLCTVSARIDQAALCTFTVVLDNDQADKAWYALHEGNPDYAESAGDIPLAPYCAVRGEMGLLYHQETGRWLDAYLVAIAWACMEGPRAPAVTGEK